MQEQDIIKVPLGKCLDVTGQTFNFLTAIEYVGRFPIHRAIWRWQCALCSNTALIRTDSVMSGHAKSCGCYSVIAPTKHGHGKHGEHSSEWESWKAMNERCRSAACLAYAHYGGRGIAVCEGLKQFVGFYAVLGNKSTPQHSIDRFPDNNGHYSCGVCSECLQNGWPLNVRWATPIEQNRNTRANKLITHNGETLCYSEWEERIGLPKRTVSQRLRNGWYPEDAISLSLGSTPIRRIHAAPPKRRPVSVVV